MTFTVGTILQETALFFEKRGLDSARLEAELLLSYILGTERLRLYLDHDRPLTSAEINEYKEVIRQRLSGKPLAYITGKKSFLKWDFFITPDVLIPRPETEILVEKTLEMVKDQATGAILELGTGSGAIALSLAHYLPAFQFDAVDISPAALRVASENALRQNLYERVSFYGGDLYAALPNEKKRLYTGIVSNPPYISSQVIPGLSREVREEPLGALDGGPDGTEMIKRIIERAFEYLAPGGFLALEHGHDQYFVVEETAKKAGFTTVLSYQDYAGFPRVAICQSAK
ncbi:MAG TPA: peptide chain release factor N(5)-glutamine methyltransferase [Firmicutes bacterium]|jgi:release factor glutamine methyltransferase|nr:peptide chain release factor N(5)-glutamine methyltransferase [Bacillota bacterium]HBT15645.1 peptide chain release factor N(5)-glutamine methyltransferase [Bacillota bacterium]